MSSLREENKTLPPGEPRVDPRVYLALDNCFAKKRWCDPSEWIPLVRELGVRYVEASADNEIDPFFSSPGVIADWRKKVLDLGARHDVRVAVCYSGHGSYSTLGLAHYDPRIRAHLREHWFRPMIELAASLDSWLGFFAHAFDERTLRDPARHAEALDTLIGDIGALARHAADAGLRGFGVEQMYSPNQPPWTLEGAREFLVHANEGAGAPVYITVDTGHQCGQRLFRKPNREGVRAYHSDVKAGRRTSLYLGCREHEERFRRAVLSGMSPEAFETEVAEFVDAHAYLFSRPEDGDLYQWIERFARCSPILHLQQSDGQSSAHRCFTAAYNASGIVDPGRVLRSMEKSFALPGFAGAPSAPGEVFLVLEPFLPTACRPREWLEDIAESVAYWRRYVPEDGRRLSRLRRDIGDRADTKGK